MGSATQFGRFAQLLLLNGKQALDLSALHFRFRTTANDVETPNNAVIRVYNLKDETTALAIDEFSSVTVDVGYGSQGANIFKGTIKQFVKGRENNVDSFLEIRASDTDAAYNFAVMNTTVPAGSTPMDRVNKILGSFQDADQAAQSGISQSGQGGVTLDPNAATFLSGSGGILPRGKVFYGLARSYMADEASSLNLRWSIQNGVLTVIPLDGYLPGEAVVINSATGMVGVPETTDQGISVRVLINPQIKIGRSIRLNNKDITQTIIKQQFFPSFTDLNLVPTVDPSADGTYRVIVIEHEGDTRANEWYSNLTCLKIDASSGKVFPYLLPQS